MNTHRSDPLTGHPDPAASSSVTQEGTWQNLIALAGPEQAAWLVRQIESDLTGQHRDLARALGRLDAAGVRAATHGLTALSGTIGATGVQKAAAELNSAAHLGDADLMLAIGSGLLRDLSVLLQDIAARRERLPTAPIGGQG
jgi:hypothetical protein